MTEKKEVGKYAKKTPGPRRGRTGNTKTLKKKFLLIYAKKMANISEACKALKMSRRTYYDWMENDPKFVEIIEDIQEDEIDWAESKLKERIKEKDTTANIFFLKTKGKKRGYIEKTESEFSGGVDLRISRIITKDKPPE